jgi:putative colanic acid biosynthesis UDP-glucose lipid carrier transferase
MAHNDLERYDMSRSQEFAIGGMTRTEPVASPSAHPFQRDVLVPGAEVGRSYVTGVVKRTMDIVISLLALTFFSPVMAAVFLAVKLTSTGPGIFVQRRNGLDGQSFSILKFRSMYVHGDDGVIRQASRGDSRVTGIGRILRKLSIDELPQLINVLKGDMSIVGPRPHAVQHDAHYAPIVVGYGRRFSARPGITGLAQVTGHRGETLTTEAMQARIDKDVEYLKTASLLGDLRIMVATVREMVFCSHVY